MVVITRGREQDHDATIKLDAEPAASDIQLTIVIIHGAFHSPEHFRDVAGRLSRVGYDVVLPKLPSVGMTQDPGDALHLDASTVFDTLKELLVSQSKDVILVMHSYGGLVGTEGFAMWYENARATKAPTLAKVKRLVYLAAHGPVKEGTIFIPPGVKLPHLSVDENGIMTHLLDYERFYEGDCSREECQEAMEMCRPMCSSVFTTPTKYAGWRDYDTPCTYIKCINDRAVLPSKCDEYIAQMQSAGVDVTVETMDCGHSPAHVAPQALTDLILRTTT